MWSPLLICEIEKNLLTKRLETIEWDGKGYLYRLKGEPIPLPARIFAVVDAFVKLLPASQPANDKVECDYYFLEKACRKQEIQ